MHIELTQNGLQISILKDGIEVGKLYYSIRRGNQVISSEKVRCENHNVVIAEFPDAELHDEIYSYEGMIKITRHWKMLKSGKWQLSFGYLPSVDLRQWIIPAVMYDENKMGTGKFPRGGIEEGWSFREDRIPVPSCSILHNSYQWQAVFTEPAKSEDDISSVKTYLRDDRPAFEIRVPYSEEPRTYTEKGIIIGGLSSRTKKLLAVKETPFEYSRTFYIMSGEGTHICDIFIRLMSTALNEFGNGDENCMQADWSQIASLKFRHLKYLLLDDPNITAIKMGKGNGLFQSFYEYTAGSFLVKGLEGATVFARIGEETGKSEYIDIAERIGTFFLGGAMPGGMHRDCYSLKKGEWGGYMGVGTPITLQKGANARCNGEVMTNYLRLSKLLENNKRNREKFLNTVKHNADFYIRHQLKGEKEGSFGRWWDLGGNPMNTLGTNGAYIISLMVELEKTEGKRADIDTALEKAGKYYASLVETNGFYADTLDADCVDKEAGCALLRAFLDLYERSHDEFYLKYARLAAGFILSWMFTYNTTFSPKSMLGKRGFRTLGMTAVSIAHHHLDFYGLFIAYDFLRLWDATKDELWKKCAQRMIDACGQLISREKDLLVRGMDFIGWQPEQINQTNWDYKHRILGTKGRYHTCVAWVVVLTLGAMLDIRERFPYILNFKFLE